MVVTFEYLYRLKCRRKLLSHLKHKSLLYVSIPISSYMFLFYMEILKLKLHHPTVLDTSFVKLLIFSKTFEIMPMKERFLLLTQIYGAAVKDLLSGQ